jgi:phosphoribosylaminoimidazole-succinocarboxamide synthase
MPPVPEPLVSGRPETLFDSRLSGVRQIGRGKVRDIYEIDREFLLIVTTDRLSAFDVVLPTPIPGKGAVLTRLSEFWFRRTEYLIGNHLADMPLELALPTPAERARIGDRARVVRRLWPLPFEAVVRGYLVGSGWRDYRDTGSVCGIRLPKGLRQAERLSEPIFTPSSKAAEGEHDQNVTFSLLVERLGKRLASRVRELSVRIYQDAHAYALERGIIIADTKLEFGLGADGELILIDELLTPDSSRFWPVDQYRPGANPPSFDKQYVRDYLEQSGWNKRPPAPQLPAEIVRQTAAKYRAAEERLIRG